MLKYQYICKKFTLDWTPIFVIKKVKNTVLCTHVIEDLNGEEIVRRFYEKESLELKRQ